MKSILTAAILATFTTLIACTPDKKTVETDIAEAASEEQTATAATDTTLTDSKKELMQTIAHHTMFEIEMGKLAAQKGTTDDVKQNGQQMEQLYKTRLTELQEMAQAYNVSLDTTLAEDHRKHITDLEQQKAADFDKKYWETLTDTQKETLGEYEDVLKDITEADATAFGIWARTSEKELRAQYEQALAQQQQLKNR